MGQDSQLRSSMAWDFLTAILLQPRKRALNGSKLNEFRKNLNQRNAAGIRVEQWLTSGGYLVILESLSCRPKKSSMKPRCRWCKIISGNAALHVQESNRMSGSAAG